MMKRGPTSTEGKIEPGGLPRQHPDTELTTHRYTKPRWTPLPTD